MGITGIQIGAETLWVICVYVTVKFKADFRPLPLELNTPARSGPENEFLAI